MEKIPKLKGKKAGILIVILGFPMAWGLLGILVAISKYFFLLGFNFVSGIIDP